MNPMELIKMFKGNQNPKELAMRLVQMTGQSNNPMIKNLMSMAENGNNVDVEQFARNFFNEQGKNFDEQYSQFISQIK